MSAGVPSCGPARAGAAAGDGLRVGRWPRGLDAPRKQGGTPATFFRAPVSGGGGPRPLWADTLTSGTLAVPAQGVLQRRISISPVTSRCHRLTVRRCRREATPGGDRGSCEECDASMAKGHHDVQDDGQLLLWFGPAPSGGRWPAPRTHPAIHLNSCR